MSFKYKELFLLIAIFEAINGLALENSSNGKSNSKDLSPVTVAEKFQNLTSDKGTTESVTVVIPNSSNIISNSSGSQNIADITSSTTVNTTLAPPTSPVTTVTPPVTPEPWKTGRWVVRDEKNNFTCIIAQMAMQINITYPGKTQVENATVNVPDNAAYNGSCKESAQFLNITWGPGYTLLINFAENKTAKNYFISDISLDVNATALKDVADGIEMLKFKNNSKEFSTPLNMSYKCNKAQNVNLTSTQDKANAVLQIKDTQYEAFMNKSNAEFAAAQDCTVFDTPDIVPIAVGCALAILVLVVLVAYLIARKRSHSQGYLSM